MKKFAFREVWPLFKDMQQLGNVGISILNFVHLVLGPRSSSNPVSCFRENERLSNPVFPHFPISGMRSSTRHRKWGRAAAFASNYPNHCVNSPFCFAHGGTARDKKKKKGICCLEAEHNDALCSGFIGTSLHAFRPEHPPFPQPTCFSSEDGTRDLEIVRFGLCLQCEMIS